MKTVQVLGLRPDRVRNDGFFYHDTYVWLGCSPDAFYIDPVTNKLVIVEVKCPLSRQYSSINDTPEYMCQVQGQLAITGAEKCFFVIYRWCPILKDYGLVIEEIRPNPVEWDFMLHEYLIPAYNFATESLTPMQRIVALAMATNEDDEEMELETNVDSEEVEQALMQIENADLHTQFSTTSSEGFSSDEEDIFCGANCKFEL